MKLKFGELIRAPMIGVNAYKVVEICLKNIEFSKDDIVLDIGCGAGHFEFLLSKSVAKIIGCDISKSLVELLNQNPKPENVEFVCLDVTKSPPKESLGFFDKIICTDVMEHVESPEALLDFVAGVLKRGGVGVVTLPINNVHHGRNYFTKLNIYELFRNSPLQAEIKVFKMGKRWILVDRLYTLARRLLGKPVREVNSCEYSVWLSMMQKPSKIFLLYKLILTLLGKASEGSFYEDESGDRALVSIKKSSSLQGKEFG